MAIQMLEVLQEVVNKYAYIPVNAKLIHNMEFDMETIIYDRTGTIVRVRLEPNPVIPGHILLKDITFRESW